MRGHRWIRPAAGYLPLCALLLGLTLQGCGVVYIAPDVARDDPNVTVIPLTADSIIAANAARYTPRSVPPAFSQVAGTGVTPRAQPTPPQPSLTAELRPTGLPRRLPPLADPGPYRIGVGDVLSLSAPAPDGDTAGAAALPPFPSSRVTYQVQDDGMIALPDVGRIALAGLTLEEAEAAMFAELVASRRAPAFSLEITGFNARKVSLGGAVGAPAVLPVTLTPLTLSTAFAGAGGLAVDDPAFASIRLYRAGTLYHIPVADYLQDPALQRLRLLDGDSIFVDTAFSLDRARAYFEEQITLQTLRQSGQAQALAALETEVSLQRAQLEEARGNFRDRMALDALPRDYVYLTGEVTRPGRFAMAFDQQTTLAEALFADGGFSAETGNPAQIYVLRGSDTAAVTAWHLDARNVAQLLVATKMHLHPGDIIFVAAQPVTRWNRVVAQLVPSLITSGASIAAN